MNVPNKRGYFGPFGGAYVPETLSVCLAELAGAYEKAKKNHAFKRTLRELLREYAFRPTCLYHAANVSRSLGSTIYLKREDALHTGAHKINNALGQALLARYMGKRRIIAETGAGQHGVATATVCALLGMQCDVYMGSTDIERQQMNVLRMKVLGARVVPVESGSKTLKDAANEAFRDWVTNVRTTYYLLGSVIGPHPYPMMVRDFQAVIGREARAQVLRKEGRLPDAVVACVGGGSNAMGIFHPFVRDAQVRLIGVEAAGFGLGGEHAASLVKGSVGVFQGTKSYVLQDAFGQVKNAHSIAPGLDYPGVGPEHAFYKHIGRAEYACVSDRQALEGFRFLCRLEGIVPALESSHAVAYVQRLCRSYKGKLIVVCLSGRGDKDLDIIRTHSAKNEL